MTSFNIKTFLSLFICYSGLIYSQHNAIPTYEVIKTKLPVNIDGVLNDEAWGEADLIDNFVLNTGNSPSPYLTEAKVLYDDEFLYFAFRCADDNIWSTKTKRDDHLWEEEVVEVFLQPNKNEKSYIELEVNPLGALLDSYMLDSVRNLPFDSWNITDIKWAVSVEGTIDGEPGDSEWCCEIAFPLLNAVTAVNIPPQNGDAWYMNLYRAELKPAYTLISWSPTFKDDFHMPGFFGKLIFSEMK